MKPLHPDLQRAFTQARQPHAPELPPPFLEDRLITQWRASDAETAPPYRLALACACACLAVSAGLAYQTLTSPTDPAVTVANAAVFNLFSL